jgi:hypothetical protein
MPQHQQDACCTEDDELTAQLAVMTVDAMRWREMACGGVGWRVVNWPGLRSTGVAGAGVVFNDASTAARGLRFDTSVAVHDTG